MKQKNSIAIIVVIVIIVLLGSVGFALWYFLGRKKDEPADAKPSGKKVDEIEKPVEGVSKPKEDAKAKEVAKPEEPTKKEEEKKEEDPTLSKSDEGGFEKFVFSEIPRLETFGTMRVWTIEDIKLPTKFDCTNWVFDDFVRETTARRVKLLEEIEQLFMIKDEKNMTPEEQALFESKKEAINLLIDEIDELHMALVHPKTTVDQDRIPGYNIGILGICSITHRLLLARNPASCDMPTMLHISLKNKKFDPNNKDWYGNTSVSTYLIDTGKKLFDKLIPQWFAIFKKARGCLFKPDKTPEEQAAVDEFERHKTAMVELLRIFYFWSLENKFEGLVDHLTDLLGGEEYDKAELQKIIDLTTECQKEVKNLRQQIEPEAKEHFKDKEVDSFSFREYVERKLMRMCVPIWLKLAKEIPTNIKMILSPFDVEIVEKLFLNEN